MIFYNKPKLNVKGLEISSYAINNAKTEVVNLIDQGNAMNYHTKINLLILLFQLIQFIT